MKPLILKMAEFGPYRCKHTKDGYEPKVIDFRAFGGKGIVLVTGDTGAGKTTIYDAISYALYGEPSGEYRQKNSLRSQNAPADSPTYVELTFRYQDTDYIVYRQPEYERAKKKGTGTTPVSAQAWLKCGDQVLAEGKKVTDKITEIIGLTREQFSRIMMIAQGEFLKLLMAPTSKRQEIMRKLFHTDRYQALADELKTRRKTLNADKKKEQELMKAHIGKIRFPEGETFAEDAAALHENRLTADEQLTLFNRIIEADETDKKQVESQIEADRKLKETAVKNLQIAQDTDEKKKQLQDALAEIEQKKQALAELEEVQKQAEAEQPKIESYQKEAVKLEQLMPDYEKVKTAEQELAKLESNAKSKQENCDKAAENVESAEKALASMQEEQIALRDAGVALQNVQHQLEDHQKETDSFGKLMEQYTAFCRSRKELEQAKISHQDAQTALSAAKAACDNCDKNITSLTETLGTFEGIDGRTEQLKTAHRDAVNHEIDVRAVRALLAECANAEKLLKAQEKRCDAQETAVQEASQKLEQTKERLNTYETQSKELSDCETVRSAVQSKQEKLTEHQNKLKKLHSDYEEYQKLRSEMELAQKAEQDAGAASVAKNAKYNTAFKRFLANQAGLIASELHIGDTCPVCGNVCKTLPQHSQAQVITEDELSEYKQSRDEAEELFGQRSSESKLAASRVSDKAEALSENAQELLDCTLEALPAAMDQAQAKAEQDAAQLKDELRAAEARVKLAAEIAQNIEDAKKSVDSAQSALDDAKQQQAEADKEKSSLSGKCEEKSRQMQDKFREVIGEMLSDADAQCRESLEQAQQKTAEAQKALDEQKTRLYERDNAKQQLEQAQQAKETANEILERERETEQKARDAVNALDGSVKSQEMAFLAEMTARFGDVPAEQTAAKLADEEKRLDAEETALKQAETDTKHKADRFDKLDKEIPAQTKACEDAKSRLNSLNQELGALNATILEKQSELAKKREALPYPEQARAEERMQFFRSEAQRLTEAIETAKQNCINAKQEISGLNGSMDTLRKYIEDAPKINLAQVQEEKRLIEERLAASESRRDVLNERIGSNRHQRDEVSEFIRSISQKDKDLNIIERLYMAANGVSDKTKAKDDPERLSMTLETYVLAGYLDKILVFANQRLITMTNGHYRMRRATKQRSGGGYDGLEINVIDTWAGDAERAVHSLSGGEGFMASMALALGFSEVIQHSAGGIQLDSMFIDEGFGTLDSDTLAQSMRVLADLSSGDRLIGLISHVTELKNRIDKQIIVKKDHTGNSSLEFQT